MTTPVKPLLACLVAASCFLVIAAEPPSALPEGKLQGTDKTARAPLEGSYSIVSGEMNGKAVPAEDLKGRIVRFTADTIVGTDSAKKEFFTAAYTLDTGHTPWVIKMKSGMPKAPVTPGLVKKDGDTVTLVYSIHDAAAPTEFRTKQNQHLFVMKRMEKK
jgi:uncharacterized protein (TIGR03067 family)